MPNTYESLRALNISNFTLVNNMKEARQFTNNGLSTCRVTLCPRAKYTVFQIEFSTKQEKVAISECDPVLI